MFLEILQNSRENTCARVFLIKLQVLACNLIKKETQAQVFSCEFCEISKNTFFTEHFWATVSAFCKFKVDISVKNHSKNLLLWIQHYNNEK